MKGSFAPKWAECDRVHPRPEGWWHKSLKGENWNSDFPSENFPHTIHDTHTDIHTHKHIYIFYMYIKNMWTCGICQDPIGKAQPLWLLWNERFIWTLNLYKCGRSLENKGPKRGVGRSEEMLSPVAWEDNPESAGEVRRWPHAPAASLGLQRGRERLWRAAHSHRCCECSPASGGRQLLVSRARVEIWLLSRGELRMR